MSLEPLASRPSRWWHFLWFSAAVFMVAAGFAFGSARSGKVEAAVNNDPRQLQFREGSNSPGEYRFINPLLTCELSSKKEIAEFTQLKSKIQSLVDDKVYAGEAGLVSVYFDTRDGRWLTINGNEKYFPASLMKVPVMIAALKVAERDPDFLRKKLTWDGKKDLNAIENFKPRKTLQPGRTYAVDELIERMVVYSDNDAGALLLSALDGAELEEVVTDLGLSLPQAESESLSDFMTVKQYARFFRVLYNSTYLNREMSEKALGYLSRSDAPDGLRGDIPEDVVTARKFGERAFGIEKDGPKELHDCGIIYHPGHPYLLCVMTKGKDFARLASTVNDVFRLVYEEIDAEQVK